ncbi:MAG: transcription termination/antitermination NusG family protein [Acidobacteriota bacterium]
MPNWYVINTKPNRESQVEKLFTEGGFCYYNPVYRQEGRVRPFFPSYGFLVFEFPAQYQMVKFTRGVKRVVGSKVGPIPIPEAVIQELKAREIQGLIELEKHGVEPRVGDQIEVAEGPLRGLRGIFQKEVGDKERVMILLSYVSYQGQLLIEKKKLKKVAR